MPLPFILVWTPRVFHERRRRSYELFLLRVGSGRPLGAPATCGNGIVSELAKKGWDWTVKARDVVQNRKGKRGDLFRHFLPENRFCPTPNIYGQKETNREPGEDG